MVKGKFSVTIPTLQRSPDLWPSVEQMSAHPLVHEVLVINNAPAPLSWDSPKVRVLQQPENIFVNPAWNLGAREAEGEYLAIVNDDVRFEDEVLDYVAMVLRRGLFGIVGPDRSCFHGGGGKRRHRLARPSATMFGFGTFMAMRRTDYTSIPEEMRIWGGDDWLVSHSRRPPACLLGFRFATEMSTTAGSPEIQRLRSQEQAVADRLLPPLHGSRWWHRPSDWIESMRMLRHRARASARR